MSVITITTDLGTSDYYLAALKGSILKAFDAVQIVDLNCNIRQYNIRQAAYNIREAFKYFPVKTIHVAHINANAANPKILLIKHQEQFVVTFDNTLLSLLPKEFTAEVFALNNTLIKKEDAFLFDALALVVSRLAQGKNLREIATPYLEFEKKNLLKATITNMGIKGIVEATDVFGNVITNIHRDLFYEYVKDQPFEIAINHETISTISKGYYEAEEGDIIAVFNSSGFLEIAIKENKASNLLGLSVDNAVLVTLVAKNYF
ncbi:MAG: SAM-dependent chlorinase/fluorinase [Chitinophagales bacterium]|nr:SAM-dependent chlorinase/fluorinase [Chitinophagales bacterium]